MQTEPSLYLLLICCISKGPRHPFRILFRSHESYTTLPFTELSLRYQLICHELSHNVRKRTVGHVSPAKIRIFSGRILDSQGWKLLQPAQTVRIHRLIWVFAWCTRLNVRFLTSLRKHAYSNILKNFSPNNEYLQIKNSDILHISVQNTDCGYWRGGSNEYHNRCFFLWAEIRKK